MYFIVPDLLPDSVAYLLDVQPLGHNYETFLTYLTFIWPAVSVNPQTMMSLTLICTRSPSCFNNLTWPFTLC